MSSYDSKPQFPSDSSDNNDLDDIALLFEEFEEQPQFPRQENLQHRTKAAITDSMNADTFNKALDNLFDDEDVPSPPLNTAKSPSLNERITFSSLPSDEEINDLFEDFDLSSDAKASFPLDSPAHRSKTEDDKLLRLFVKDQETESEDSFDELKALLGNQQSPQLSVPPAFPGFKEADLIVLNEGMPILYPALEDLEEILKQPIGTHRLNSPNFAELEALINTPAQFQLPAAMPNSLSVAPQNRDWDDMEELAIEMGHKISPPPSATRSAHREGVLRSTPKSRPAKVKGFEETVRVSVKQLDNLSNLIGELVVKRNRLEQDQERLRQFLDNLLNHVQSLSDVGGRMQDLYERTLLEGALLASRNRLRGSGNSPEMTVTQAETDGAMDQDLDALEMDRFTGFHLLSQEMIELIVRVREASSDIQFLVDETDQVGRGLRQNTTQLQEGMTTTRMVTFGPSADRLIRPVREISRQLKKQARLNVEGKDVLIDKMILEHLSSPLTHLVNNAVTHGIESPEERQQQGKPPEGQINIRAFLQGNQTVLTFADDGGGIDPLRIKQKAIEKHLVTPEEALALSENEIYDFLFHPGFSTKDQADQFAGRGVGLDVVRTSLNEIRGSVTIHSEIGKGTTFTIRLPLTLSICKALCCLSNYARVAFPMDGVEDMKDYTIYDLPLNDQEKRCIRWGQSLLPIYSLNELLVYNRQLSRGSVYGGRSLDDTISIVILRGAGDFLAVQVDQVIGEQEIVIKQIEGPAPKPPGIAGATVLGDGSIMPIGDVLELIEIAQGRIRTDVGAGLWRSPSLPPKAELPAQSEPTILIVDDSLTVRQYLSHSFSKAGYRVEQARDGQEAWEKLRSGLPCDIVFCDIEMPRMNGLELLSSLQKDEQLSAIPVALLTSRGADRHRKVAAKLGASGYYIKPAPDAELLEGAKRMIDGEVLLPGSVRKPQVKFSENAPASSMSHSVSERQTVSGPPVVLIVDDSVMVREMLSQSFSGAGYRYEQARDGQDALEKLRSGLRCDLILCDIEMPKMNGLELLSRLQDDEYLCQIPVAMITSRGAQKMQQKAAERGAKGYFVKPYIENVLLDAAKRLIAGEVLLDTNRFSEV